MTSLTDKMEELREKDVEPNESGYGAYESGINNCLDKCIALAKAEAAVVRDWEAEFDAEFDHIVASQGGFIVGRKGTNFDNCATGLDGIKDFITNLLTAKDREVARASARKEREKVEQVYSELRDREVITDEDVAYVTALTDMRDVLISPTK